ncbi:MAG TPA: thiamine pyrophosphate-dependent dehydrogenase E1 component subunit alpha [Bryobacteraceae bacterium]|nr:thiamine pyrophosphate-dependent dehydrogenase E1 component subunit alpha [Bryobacteraceae bacterium]
MVRIRTFEERVADLVDAGEIKTPCHLYIGQEAVAAGICANLRPEDTVWGGHRSHGHYLAKGGNLRAALAEIFGRATGCSGGRGGSMHLIAPSHGILGTVPIVAATVPLAVGAALAAKLQHRDIVAVAFFGDGTLEEGHVHESMNIAALYRLPIVFVCENNLYASHMHLSARRIKETLAEAGSFHGIPSLTVDGNDAEAVSHCAGNIIQRARSGNGPSFLECLTFRWRGHVGPSWDTDVGVKRRDELKDWLPKDPIARTCRLLCERGMSEDHLAAIRRDAAEEVDAAVEFARSSPYPGPDRIMDHVFAIPNSAHA